jgi:DTW domain-containing protein YfiP
LSLPKTRVLVGEDFTDNETLNRLLDDDIETSVLFPDERAIVLHSPRSSELGVSSKRFILIDGTWKKAYKIWQLSTNLHSLPLVKLPEDLQGDYRIRKAPSENSLSTVEAGYHLLSTIEPERDFSALLSAFKNMIDFQIQQMPPELYRKHYGND